MPGLVDQLLGKASMANHPTGATMELTYACNLHCLYCYNPVVRKGQERTRTPEEPPAPPLTYEEVLGVLDQLRDMGVLYLTLTGGEPMLHPRFWDIAAEAKRRAFAIRLFSNGVMINERVADRLSELRPFCIEISLHGATDATAEALNQVPGSHQKLLQALALLKERELTVYLKTVVTRILEHEIMAMKELADSFGFPLYFDPVLTPTDDGDLFPLSLKASDEGLRTLYRRDGINLGVSPFERTGKVMNCGVGSSTMHIGPYGDVQPCVQWKASGGNVRRHRLQAIWEGSEVFHEAREASRLSPRLFPTRTEDHDQCHHCPALSKHRYGDAMAPEEQKLRVARIRKEIAAAESPLPA